MIKPRDLYELGLPRGAVIGAVVQLSKTPGREMGKGAFAAKLAALDKAGVRLLSAGIDENPNAYKDIHAVMAAQTDLVEVIARFDPRIVKMAPEGEQPED